MKRLFIILVAAVALGWAGNASATRVSDDFNRANSGTLGANWSNALGFGSGLQIISNQAANVVGGLNASCWGANSFSNDQVSIVTLTNALPDADDEVMVRASLVARTAYFGGSRPGDSAFYMILDYVAGVKNILATSATTPIIGDTIELDAVGATLTLKLTRSGVQTVLLTATDASIASGCVGIETGDTGSSAARMDNWSGGDFFLDHTGGQLISAPMFPQATPSAVYPPDTGYTLTAVASGANLQTAITAAACGTKLNLAHGGTFTSGSAWALPNNSCSCHTDPTKWQIIQGDQFEANYIPGVRVDPSAQYAQFPHLSNSDGNYAFTANTNGASCWGFAGLDVTETTDGATAVLSLGDGSVTVANFPHDFAVWGSSIHGQASKGVTRCIVFNGNWGAVIDSYLSDCHKVGQDSQAVEMWDGLGPLLVQNTFLEGATENILIGGSDPHAGVIPSDFTFQKNHFFKPLSWRLADPSYVGIHWAVKNCFELKDAQRVLITGNVFENGWGDGQNGQCITWNSSNQSGTDPQAVIADINMYLNVIRHFAYAYQIAGNTNPTYQSDHRINIHDNLSWDIDVCIWANCNQNQVPDISLGGRNNGTLYATYDLSINHETIASREGQNQGGAINFNPTDSTPYYGFNVTNSILNNGAFGAFYRTAGSGDAIMPSLTPGGHANNNCIFGSLASGYSNAIFNGKQLVTAGQSGVFVNPGVDFHVAPASPCYQAGSDGKSMGADIDAVNAATAGVTEALANPHTVTNVSPSTFTHLGSTSITITGTNFISGAAEVIVGGAGPAVAVSTDICAVNTCTVVTSAPITLAVNDTVNMAGMVNGLFLNPNQGQFIVASVTDTTHFTYTDNGIGTQSWLGGTANRITPGNACTSVVVVNSTTITCTTPAATGTVTNGPVSIFVSQWGIPVQSTVYGLYN